MISLVENNCGHCKRYEAPHCKFSFKLQCLVFSFSQGCAVSHPLLPEWTTSKKPSAAWQGSPPNTDPMNLCQAICTICWAWFSGGRKGGQLELLAWKCHLLGKYQSSQQKASKQSPLPVQKEDWLNMVAFLTKVFSFQTLRSLFLSFLASFWGRILLCHVKEMWAETFHVSIVGNWEAGHLETFVWFCIRGRVIHSYLCPFSYSPIHWMLTVLQVLMDERE